MRLIRLFRGMLGISLQRSFAYRMDLLFQGLVTIVSLLGFLVCLLVGGVVVWCYRIVFASLAFWASSRPCSMRRCGRWAAIR